MTHATRALLLASAAALLACDAGEPLDPSEPGIVRVDVTPATTELFAGDTARFQATPITAAGPVNRHTTWISTNPAVAVVDSTGRVEARAPGTATIRATAGGVSGEATLRVPALDLMFFSYGGGIFAETLVLPPGSGGFPERLFPAGRYARDAVPSPDGTRIAYVTRDALGYFDIWVANRDGTDPRVLVATEGDDEWPTWSPDGQRLAFQSDVAGANDIYVIDLDGSGLRRLTSDPLPGVTSEVTPAWSPDGTRIAYASNRNGTYDLFTVRPDGTDTRPLTSLAASVLEPAWSPDGSRLAVRLVDGSEWDLAILDAEGALLRTLTLSGLQRSPSWRSDGALLAYSARTTAENIWQIWTVRPDGSGAQQQTPDNFTGGHRPVWLKRDAP